LGFDDGAALALVDELVLFDADADVLGAVLVSEPQPDSITARAAAIAAAPETAVDLMNVTPVAGDVCQMTSWTP
jgi:hypothetical protein